MGLDDGPGDADEGGAPHLVGVQLGLECPQPRHHHGGGQLGQQVLPENIPQGVTGKGAHALHGLEQDVAGEAVGDDDVAAALDGLLGLDVADEVQVALLPGLAQQGQSLLLQVRALAVLRADVQQAHPGALQSQHPAGIEAAQIRKLHQVLRGALGVGPAVDEHSLAAGGGDHRGHSRPADAPDALGDQGGPGQQGPGGPGGNQGIGLAVPQQGQAHAHGGVLLVPEHLGGVVAHLHRLRGVDDLHPPGDGVVAAVPQGPENGLGVAGQQHLHAPVLHAQQGALHDFQRGVVAAHGVNDDLHSSDPPALPVG